MNLKLNVLALTAFIILSCSSINNNSTIDKNLIIPGKSAEGYVLGESIDDNISILCLQKDKSIAEIMEIKIFSDIKFDCILYFKNTSVIFLKNKSIIAIAGLKTERRITSDGVLLSSGVDNFILNYGNSGLLTVSNGKHRLYFYKDPGIAIFNDNDDNIIDMYLIFKPDIISTSPMK